MEPIMEPMQFWSLDSNYTIVVGLFDLEVSPSILHQTIMWISYKER